MPIEIEENMVSTIRFLDACVETGVPKIVFLSSGGTVYGDGSVVRDYIYIEDAIDGILKIAERQGDFRLYNLGSGTGHSLKEVLQVITRVVDKMPQIIYKSGRSMDMTERRLPVENNRKLLSQTNSIGRTE